MSDIQAEVLSLLLGGAKEIPCENTEEWWDKPWRTALFKESQTEACWLGYEGFRADDQVDRANHGGVERAVCVYPGEHYLHWRPVLNLPGFPHGAFGENLTTKGLLEASVCIGDVFHLGEARVQVSQPRQPCWKIGRRWQIKDLAAQVERTGYTGFYFRVLHHGYVRAGDSLSLVDRPCPEWTIENCNEVHYRRKDDPAAARALAACPFLSGGWRDSLWSRANKSA